MEFGLLTLCDWLPDPATGARLSQRERFRQIVQLAVAAEQSGFSSVHLGEHHFSDYILSSPPVVLAAIAERTTRLRLSTGITLTANLDPVRVAEDYATLDQLSGGRMELVAGRGNAFLNTYRQFGHDIRQSRERFEEGLELLCRLWTGTNVNWEGRFRAKLQDVTLQPRPVQSPLPPIWLGAGSSADSIAFAAVNGFPLQLPGVFAGAHFFKDFAAQYRRDFTPGLMGTGAQQIGFTAHIHVRSSGAAARNYWAPYHLGYLNWVWSEIGRYTGAELPKPTAESAFGDPIHSPALCGSPDEIVERLLRWDETLGGINRMLLKFDAGGMPEREIMRAMDLFAGGVMPQVARAKKRAA